MIDYTVYGVQSSDCHKCGCTTCTKNDACENGCTKRCIRNGYTSPIGEFAKCGERKVGGGEISWETGQ